MTIIELILIGCMTGVIGGLLGIGGSLVMIPAMTEILGPDQHLYQAVAMIVNLFVALPAVYQHYRAGALRGSTVLRLAPLAMVGVIAGVAVSETRAFAGSREAYLRGVFGLFLLGVCIHEFRLLVRLRPWLDALRSAGPPPLISSRSVGLVALPTGFFAGLLGLGGGVLAVPLQCRLLKVPIRPAIANSAALIVSMSVVGGAYKNYSYYTDNAHSLAAFSLALVLIPTAVAGSFLGSYLTHRIPVRGVRAVFLIFLSLSAVRLTYGAGKSIHELRKARSLPVAARELPAR